MRLALIPPFAHMDLVKKTDYQLLLPQNWSNADTVTQYRKARANGSFMILDNGAAEGLTYTSTELHDLANLMMVNEIVVHDTLGNATDTWAKVQAWAPTRSNKFNYMAVVQGQTWEDIDWILRRYNNQSWIDSVGVPRHFIDTLNTHHARVEIVEHIRINYGKRFNIHLLGTAPSYIRELREKRRAFESLEVRGVDTSAPFNYAWASQSMKDGGIVERPADYFNLTGFPADYLELNLDILRRWTINDGRDEARIANGS